MRMAKKVAKKGKKKMRVPRNRIRPGYFACKKTFYLGAIAPNIASDSSGQQGAGNAAFYIGQNNELTGLCSNFDQFRVCAVSLKFIPGSNDAMVGGGQTFGIVYTYVDHTDNTSPSGASEVMNRQSYKMHRADKVWSEYIKHPRTANPTYNGSVIVGYDIGKANQWLSTTNYNIPHYGWKWWCDSMKGQSIGVWVTMYVQFKEPK